MDLLAELANMLGHGVDRLPKLKDNPKALNLTCPISCGQCCAQSRYDMMRGAITLLSEEEHSDRTECPHLGPKGCKLPRGRRPTPCTGYLCPVAIAVVEKKLGLRRARQLVKQRKPWCYNEKDLKPYLK